jgi:putative DNA primase/helicase
MNSPSTAQAFRDGMAAHGIITHDNIIADGRLHRFHVEGDRTGSKNGWYVLHCEPYPAGSFGSWKLGSAETWKPAPPKGRLSIEDRRALQKAQAEAAARVAADIERFEAKARAEAESIWQHADLAPAGHPYLLAKKISPNGSRLYKGCLVLPVRAADHTLHSVQFISTTGEKRFLRGGRTRGCCYAMGKVGKRAYVAEGFATGTTIHEATGEAVFIAFHAGNLLPVAKAIREKRPRLELVIAADNDAWTDGNPGFTKAIEAAKASRAKVALPRFRDTKTGPTDFNDLFCLEGLEAVKTELARACKPELLEGVPGVLAASVKPGTVAWLWPGWIPRSEVTILDGDPGVGKSAIACELAGCISSGRAMPGAANGHACARGIVFVDLENSLAHTMIPRLLAAGADLKRVRIIRSITDADGTERTPEIPRDVNAIERAIYDVDAALLVIDPVVGCLPVDTDAHRDQHVRRALAPLQRLAEQTGIGLVAIRHLNKNSSTKVVYRGGGSIAFIAGARAGLVVERDPDDPAWRVLAASKASLGPEPSSLRFQLVPCGDSIRVQWGGESVYTAEALLGDTGGEEGREERAAAKEFLRGELEDGPVRATEIFSTGKKHAFSDKTLKRAKKDLGVRSYQVRMRGERWWEWRLPKRATEGPQGATNRDLAP